MYPTRCKTGTCETKLSAILQGGTGTKFNLQIYLLYSTIGQKHSKEILNFSAMRAIVSALHSLDKLRAEIKFNAPDLGSMGRLSYAHEIRETQRTNRPYLHSLGMSHMIH